MLTREQIKSLDIKPIIETIAAPELGKDEVLYVRTVTARESDEYKSGTMRQTGDKKNPIALDFTDVTAKAAVIGCCKKDGTPMFEKEDVEWLSTKPGLAPLLTRIKDAFDRINGFDSEGAEAFAKN